MKMPDKGTIGIIIVSAALLAGIGLYSHRNELFQKKENGEKEQNAVVQTERVKDSSVIAAKIEQNMSVEAKERVELLPRVTGRLLALRVKQGQKVKKGQIVAELEHEQQNADILAAAADSAAARASTEKARAALQNASANVERYRRLQKEGFSTQQQLDSMETEYKSAAAAVRAALANERRYAAEASRVHSTKNDYIIKAPIDGVVLNDYALTPGAMISPSSPILDLADLRLLKATLRVPELKIYSVHPGMTVNLEFDALPGESFHGSVSRIDQYIDPETRTGKVEIELNNDSQAKGRLRPGMFGRASIVEREYKNSITVAEGALHSKEKGEYLFVVEKGRAVARDVKTGIKEAGRVQILSGVNPGDEVIIFGGANLNDKDKVTVQNN